MTTGARLDQARFSYRPATRELKLEAHAASLHGLPNAPVGRDGLVSLKGWHELPATAGVSGWIDDALAEATNREPVECEYLARAAGQADRYFILNAVPLGATDLMVGEVAPRRAANAPAGPGEPPGEQKNMQRAWLPGPRAAGPRPSAPP